MSTQEILDGLRSVVTGHLDIHDPIDMETDVFGDLRLDSLQRTILVVELENRFEVCFDDDDEQEIRTVRDIVGVISRRRAEVGHA